MTDQFPTAVAGELDPAAPRRRGRTALPATKLSPEEVTAQLRVLAKASTAENTKRAYRSAVQQFIKWGGLLPTDENTLMRYLAEHAQVLNARTLSHRLSAISKWHVAQGFFDPTKSAAVRQILSGVHRLYGTPQVQAKALPVEDLEVIAQALAGDRSMPAMRDNALLQLGFLGGFRRSELVAIQVEHLVWDPAGLTVVLPRSKTDQLGEGMVKAIPYGDGQLCAVSALSAWLEAAHISSGPVFRPITRTGHVRHQALAAGSVSTILVRRAMQVRLPYVPQLSAHSLRRGMATSADRAGADFDSIKRHGGWKRNEIVKTYIEEANRFTKNAASVLLRKQT